MRRLIDVTLLGITLLIFNSCNEESLMDTYSSRGAEQDKAILDESAQQLDDELSLLAKTDFAIICQSMSKRIDGKTLEGNLPFFASIINVGQLMSLNQTEDCYFDELTALTYDKNGYCAQLKEEGCGVWQWNGETETFIKEKEHETDIIFKFPASDNLKGDTACLTITNLGLNTPKDLSARNVLNNAQTLRSLKLSVKINDELILTSNISNELADDGLFKVVAMTFNPKPYTFTGEMGREEQNGYWILSFNNENETILEHSLLVWFDQSNDQMPINNLINDLKINDIVITTEAHTGEIYNKLNNIEHHPKSSKAYNEALASLLNNNASILARYDHDYTILAKVEAVAKIINEDEWCVDLEFEFSDGSRVSGEEYFEEYLTSFKTDLDKLVNDFESKFGV